MAIRPLFLLFGLVLTCAAPTFAGDAEDEAYAYIAGLADKGLDEMVVKAAREFLAKNPKHARALHARYRLGSALAALGDTQGAVEALALPAFTRDFEFHAEANLRLGRARLASGDAAGAKECASKARAAGREYIVPLASALAADAHARLGEWADARSAYAAWIAAEKDPARQLDAEVGLAWVELRSGEPLLAESHVFRLVETGRATSAREGELLVLVGECALDLERAAEALERFREVRDPAWTDAAARGAGFALAALGRHAEAAVEFQRVAKLAEKSRFSAECALHEGIEKLASGDARAAREALSNPILTATSEVLLWRVRAELESDDANAALATIDAALKLPLDQASKERFQTARGTALSKLGRSNEAAEAFARSGSADGLQAAAVSLLSEKRFDEAIATAKRAAAIASTPQQTAQAWLVVGEAERGSKRFAPAEAAFLEAARVDKATKLAARARLRAAWCRFEAGDPKNARKLFESSLSGPLEPGETEEAHFMTARCLEADQDRDGAARLFDEHATRFASGTRALEARVRAVRNSDDPALLASLERALVKDPRHAWADDARLEIAEHAATARQFERALAGYLEVEKQAAEATLVTRAIYGAAWCNYSLGRFDDATRLLERLLGSGDLDSRVRAAALELAVFTSVARADLDDSLRAWRALVASGETCSNATGAARAVVQAARTKNRSAETLEVLELQERAPKLTDKAALRALRVQVLVDSGRLDEADSLLRSLATTASSDTTLRAAVAEASFTVAEARVEKGEFEAAAKLYESAALDPTLADRALYKSGFVALKRGDAARAERDLARLVETCPKSPLLTEALFLRGEALHRLERFDEALLVLERVRQEAPRHAVAPKALFRLGQCLTRAQRWQEALDVFDLLLRRSPDFALKAEIELERGRARGGLGDVRAARAAFDFAVASGAGSTADRARIEIGNLLSRSEDHAGALEQYLKVALLSSDSECVPEALFAAGNELEALGQPARAADRYREIVTQHAASPLAARARQKLEALAPKTAPQKPRRI